jgi:hypothetical protein
MNEDDLDPDDPLLEDEEQLMEDEEDEKLREWGRKLLGDGGGVDGVGGGGGGGGGGRGGLCHNHDSPISRSNNNSGGINKYNSESPCISKLSSFDLLSHIDLPNDIDSHDNPGGLLVKSFSYLLNSPLSSTNVDGSDDGDDDDDNDDDHTCRDSSSSSHNGSVLLTPSLGLYSCQLSYNNNGSNNNNNYYDNDNKGGGGGRIRGEGSISSNNSSLASKSGSSLSLSSSSSSSSSPLSLDPADIYKGHSLGNTSALTQDRKVINNNSNNKVSKDSYILKGINKKNIMKRKIGLSSLDGLCWKEKPLAGPSELEWGGKKEDGEVKKMKEATNKKREMKKKERIVKREERIGGIMMELEDILGHYLRNNIKKTEKEIESKKIINYNNDNDDLLLLSNLEDSKGIIGEENYSDSRDLLLLSNLEVNKEIDEDDLSGSHNLSLESYLPVNMFPMFYSSHEGKGGDKDEEGGEEEEGREIKDKRNKNISGVKGGSGVGGGGGGDFFVGPFNDFDILGNSLSKDGGVNGCDDENNDSNNDLVNSFQKLVISGNSLKKRDGGVNGCDDDENNDLINSFQKLVISGISDMKSCDNKNIKDDGNDGGKGGGGCGGDDNNNNNKDGNNNDDNNDDDDNNEILKKKSGSNCEGKNKNDLLMYQNIKGDGIIVEEGIKKERKNNGSDDGNYSNNNDSDYYFEEHEDNDGNENYKIPTLLDENEVRGDNDGNENNKIPTLLDEDYKTPTLLDENDNDGNENYKTPTLLDNDGNDDNDNNSNDGNNNGNSDNNNNNNDGNNNGNGDNDNNNNNNGNSDNNNDGNDDGKKDEAYCDEKERSGSGGGLEGMEEDVLNINGEKKKRKRKKSMDIFEYAKKGNYDKSDLCLLEDEDIKLLTQVKNIDEGDEVKKKKELENNDNLYSSSSSSFSSSSIICYALESLVGHLSSMSQKSSLDNILDKPQSYT